MADETMFTQEQVDAIVGQRLSRAMKGMPSESELAEFRNWKENKGKNDETIATLTKERDDNKKLLDEANAKIAKSEHESLLTSKGVPKDKVDFYDFKINQLVNDKTTYEQAMESFIKDNPVERPRVDLGSPLGGGTPKTTSNDEMNNWIRAK